MKIHLNTQNSTKWKIFEKGQRNGGLIDNSIQTALKYEVNKWKHILKTVLKCIIFCAENNLSLRGHSGDINKEDCGIFLNLIKFVSQYDDGIKNAIDSHVKNHVNYLSPKIQNEFIELLATEIRRIIIQEIQEAKYFSIVCDSIPDMAHKDQLT